MIKIQDLINIGQYEVSFKANNILTYVCDDYEPEDIVSKEEIKTKIKEQVKYVIVCDQQAYQYFNGYTDGDFEEAIDAGNKNAVDIARYYLVKELFDKLKELEKGE